MGRRVCFDGPAVITRRTARGVGTCPPRHRPVDLSIRQAVASIALWLNRDQLGIWEAAGVPEHSERELEWSDAVALLQHALEECGGRVKEAAARLGARKSVWKK